MVVSVADYRRLSGYDVIVPLVKKRNLDLLRENDSLMREISLRDSLLMTPHFPMWGYDYQSLDF